MLATLLTAALTVIGFIIGQVSEGAYKWDEDLGSTLQYTSGFLTGVYGLWNIYIFGLLFLYAPSHKTWGNEDTHSTGTKPLLHHLFSNFSFLIFVNSFGLEKKNINMAFPGKSVLDLPFSIIICSPALKKRGGVNVGVDYLKSSSSLWVNPSQ